MTKQSCMDRYFDWMCNLISDERYTEGRSYRTLLHHLHNVEFNYILDMDGNRAEDGVDLRYHFANDLGFDNAIVASYLDTSDSSVLEMMVALCVRCENIMEDPDMGDRTGQWFWTMISSLGLDDMSDDNYDEEYVSVTIDKLLEREYEPDGEGGLFTVPGCEADLRDMEIWAQMCWYLDTLI